MSRKEFFENILNMLLARCAEHDISVEYDFLHDFMHLLSCDMRLGLIKHDIKTITVCRMNTFIDEILKALTDPMHSFMINMRMVYYMKTCKEIDLAKVKQKYDNDFQQKLKVLIDDILQYPETCTKVQLDQLFVKMQIFIVTCYKLGSPKNHVILKLAEQSLNSVIARSDIQNYVLKKQYHRLEYLQRLAATVAGIIIYNNDGPDGDRENTRNLLAELNMAQDNTKEALQLALEHAKAMKKLCQNAIDELLIVDTEKKCITLRNSMEKLQRINQYTITYCIYERNMRLLHESFEKTLYLIELERKRYECVISKINDTLKMRRAIDSELIFPHFVYLAQLWATLNCYLSHLVELNRVKDDLDLLVSAEMEQLCKATIKEYTEQGRRNKQPNESTFQERFVAINKIDRGGDFTKLVHVDIGDFCAVTLTLTNGLLLPANKQLKLCKNLNINFGFRDQLAVKYGERYFEELIVAFKNVTFTNSNLALLFNIDEELIALNIQCEKIEPPKLRDFAGQTELLIVNDLSVPNRINVTWNVWDYHRKTIHLADIRKRQTHDAQTNISYGRRNAQNQTYNTRHN